MAITRSFDGEASLYFPRPNITALEEATMTDTDAEPTPPVSDDRDGLSYAHEFEGLPLGWEGVEVVEP